jgi:hypothetical protein
MCLFVHVLQSYLFSDRCLNRIMGTDCGVCMMHSVTEIANTDVAASLATAPCDL